MQGGRGHGQGGGGQCHQAVVGQVQLPQVDKVGEVDGDLRQTVEGQVDSFQHAEVGDDGV